MLLNYIKEWQFSNNIALKSKSDFELFMMKTNFVKVIMNLVVSDYILDSLKIELEGVRFTAIVVDAIVNNDQQEIARIVENLINNDDKVKLQFVEYVLELNPQSQKNLLQKLVNHYNFLINVQNNIPNIVSVIIKIVTNVLHHVEIEKMQAIILAFADLAENPEKEIDEKALLNILYNTVETSLEESKKLFPGILENLVSWLKNVPTSSVDKEALANLGKLAVLPKVDVLPTPEEIIIKAENKKAIDAMVDARFGRSYFDTDQTSEIKLLSKNEFKKQLNAIPKLLNEKELRELSYLLDIAIPMINPKIGCDANIVAIACRLYSEGQILDGKELSAPTWAGYISGMYAKDTSKQEKLRPFIFDAMIENTVLKLAREDKARKVPGTENPEPYLLNKVKMLLNQKRIGGTTEPLNENGALVLAKIISTLFEEDFAAGKKLTDPALVSRFPTILKALGLQDVSLLNRADLKSVSKKLKSETNIHLKNIDPSLVIKGFLSSPEKSIQALARPVLDAFLQGNAIEKERSKDLVGILAEVVAKTVQGKQVKKFAKKKFGIFGALKGIGIELNISTQQLLNNFKKSVDGLDKDLKNNVIPTTEQAGKHGTLATYLVDFVEGIANAQDIRNAAKLKSEIDPKIAVSMSETFLETLKYYSTNLWLTPLMMMASSFEMVQRWITPFLNSYLHKWLLSEIADCEIAIRQMEELDVLTKEEIEELKSYQDELALYKALDKNWSALFELVQKLVLSFLKRHDVSNHIGLIGCLQNLAKDPNKHIDKEELMEQLLLSVKVILKEANEIEEYQELIPGILSAITSIQSLAS
jgi:hypothetical protein